MRCTLILISFLALVVRGNPPGRETKQSKFDIFSIKTKSNLKLPNIEDVKRFAYFSAATVCNSTMLEKWNCKACPEASKTKINLIGIVENRIVGTRAYVAVNEAQQEIVVGFRGGSEKQNKYEVLGGVIPVPFFPYINDFFVLVHIGFKTAMESLIAGVESNVKSVLKMEKYKDYKIVMTGHSFGGAVASLALIRLRYDLKLDWSKLSLYTYGQNRVGNVRFASYYDSLNITVSRGVNYNDITPSLGSARHLFLAHFHNEVWIDNVNGTSYKFCDNKLIEDPNCSDSIPINKKSFDKHMLFFDTNFGEDHSC